jgi:hypothetical protein
MQVMEAVVSAYVHLWAKQRPGVHAALAALLSALASKAAALQDMLQQLVMLLLAATLAEPDPDTPLGELTGLACAQRCSVQPAYSSVLAPDQAGIALLAGPAAMDGELEAPWRTYIHCWQALLQGSTTIVGVEAVVLLCRITFVVCCIAASQLSACSRRT